MIQMMPALPSIVSFGTTASRNGQEMLFWIQ